MTVTYQCYVHMTKVQLDHVGLGPHVTLIVHSGIFAGQSYLLIDTSMKDIHAKIRSPFCYVRIYCTCHGELLSTPVSIDPFMPGDILDSNVVWTQNTFENNFLIQQKITKNLNEICELRSNKHIYFKYFLKKVLVNLFMSGDLLDSNVIWICATFENNFGIQQKFAKYLKQICRLCSNQHSITAWLRS